MSRERLSLFKWKQLLLGLDSASADHYTPRSLGSPTFELQNLGHVDLHNQMIPFLVIKLFIHGEYMKKLVGNGIIFLVQKFLKFVPSFFLMLVFQKFLKTLPYTWISKNIFCTKFNLLFSFLF